MLKEIIDNPICDKGTALMVYWMSSPGYYTQFNRIEDVDVNPEIYELLKQIEHNYLNGFYKNESISFNPQNDSMHNNLVESNGLHSGNKWVINKIFYEPTLGETFPEYKWTSSKTYYSKNLVSQDIVDCSINIILQENTSVSVINLREVEKNFLFPTELLEDEYNYKNSWSALFRLKINRNGGLDKVSFLVADNKIVLYNSSDILKLKFEPLNFDSDKEYTELNIEVRFQKNE